MSGFPNEWICDSWRVGLRRADHADRDEGRRLGDRAGGVPGLALATRCQGPRRPPVSRGAALLHAAKHYLAGAAGRVRPLELGLEAVLAAQPNGRVRGLLRCARRDEPNRASGADVQLHRGAGARLGGRRKRGQDSEALGRSRGGFSTKIHLKVDLDGLPLAFHLTEGQASDSVQFEVLLDLGPDITPHAAVGDKGYASKGNRALARERGIAPVIPHKSNEKNRPAFFPKALYRARARIEQLVGKLKPFKRIALRCEKAARNFGSFVALALGFILTKSVHRASDLP